jgi:ribonuclease Z
MENGSLLLFDCGAGTLLRLAEAGISMQDLDTVVLTHLHLDHCADVLALANARYLLGLPGLEVYGPEGTAPWLQAQRSAYPYLEKMTVSVREMRPMDAVSMKGCDIFAEEAKHSVTALAYRVDCGDKSVVYSGDTEPSSRVAALADGADLLIHECSFPEPFDVTNHTTPRKLGRLLKNVRRVVLTHFYPEAQGHEDEMAQDVEAGSGLPAEVGYDMQIIVL